MTSIDLVESLPIRNQALKSNKLGVGKAGLPPLLVTSRILSMNAT
jgi:hypothetical protein